MTASSSVGHAVVGVEHGLLPGGQHGLHPEGLGGQLPQGLADPGAGDDFPFRRGEGEIVGGPVEFAGGLPEHHPGVAQRQQPAGLLDGGGVGVPDLVRVGQCVHGDDVRDAVVPGQPQVGVHPVQLGLAGDDPPGLVVDEDPLPVPRVGHRGADPRRRAQHHQRLQQVVLTEGGGTERDHRGVRVEPDGRRPVEQAAEVPADQRRQHGVDGLPAVPQQLRGVAGVLALVAGRGCRGGTRRAAASGCPAPQQRRPARGRGRRRRAVPAVRSPGRRWRPGR